MQSRGIVNNDDIDGAVVLTELMTPYSEQSDKFPHSQQGNDRDAMDTSVTINAAEILNNCWVLFQNLHP